MADANTYLLEEDRIDRSGVRNHFTPATPIDTIENFFGRTKEVARVISQIRTPGQHSLLFGLRGIGKSSLARVTVQCLVGPIVTGRAFIKICDHSDTFETIAAVPLKHYGVLDLPDEIAIQTRESTTTGFTYYGLSASKLSGNERFEKWKKEVDLSPSAVAALLSRRPGVLLIDEADVIGSSKDRHKIAEFIKSLSDLKSPFKVIVVGVSSTASDLLAGHPSVGRAIKETKLEKMGDNGIRQIIENGAEACHLHFDSDVVDRVVELSAGFPYFAHLIGLKCAECVVRRDFNVISSKTLNEAVSESVADVEGTFHQQFDVATRSAKSNMYEMVAFGAAQVDQVEFTTEQWRASVQRVLGRPFTSTSLQRYFNRLVTDDKTAIIERVVHGLYRFHDPRMASFIRIVALKTAQSQRK